MPNHDHYYEPFETLEPWPESPAQVRARLRRTGFLFELEGGLDRFDRPVVYLCAGVPGQPTNARARRIRDRVFRRLTAAVRRKRRAMGAEGVTMRFQPTDPMDLDF